MGTYQKIFHYQRILLIVFYAIFCCMAIYPIILILQKLGITNVAIQILLPFLFVVICAIAGAYLYVISHIPLKLVDAFDEVRNKIASEEIRTVEQFADHINQFTVNFFSFMFFDVHHSAFVIGDKKNIYLSDNLKMEDIGNVDDYWSYAIQNEDIYYVGHRTINSVKENVVLVPVWFGKEYLGMMLLFIEQKPGKFFTGMIRDYEELFIDDQLLHIVNLNRHK